MYCSNCGAETVEGSRFCKRCGGTLSATQLQTPQVTYVTRPTGAAVALSLASVLVGLGGLGIVMGAVFGLVSNASPSIGPPSSITAIAIIALVFGSLTTFGIVAMLIRTLSRLMGIQGKASQPPSRVVQENQNTANGSPVQLPPAPVSVGGSVTEHTTRTFDHPAYRDRAAREQ